MFIVSSSITATLGINGKPHGVLPTPWQQPWRSRSVRASHDPHARKAPASPTRLVLISSHEADNLCFCFFPQYSAAKYYRLAEQNGNKTLGNTWVSSSVIGAARGLQNGRRR
ncbi:hypothetical protein PG989_010128 [Apiospora arundinis]